MKECINYKKLAQGVVQCQTCTHFCKIPKNQVGICGVRQNINGKLFLLVYEKATAINIDPIEKKPLFHFLPGATAYSFGTFGCNFRCGNCQNFDISQILNRKGKVKEYGQLNFGKKNSPQEIVENAKKNNCPIIAYTYNEPTIFLEYALDTMKLAHQAGLKNVWVSNGFMSAQTIETILPYLDAINVDIKSSEEKFYRTNCGSLLNPVLENCQRFVKNKVWLEITTLLIPKLSDDFKMLQRLADFIAEKLNKDVPWHISAFSGAISWKLQHLPETSQNVISQAVRLGQEAGLRYVYGGNVPTANLEHTKCPQCQNIVIERYGYNVIRHDKKGKCQCGYAIPGVWV